MAEDRNMTLNVSGGQVNIAGDHAAINAAQYNGVGDNEWNTIINGIIENLSDLKKGDADEIRDVLDMAKEELRKPEPKVSRLRNCVALIAPMITVANGIPALAGNLQKLIDYIMLYIR